MSGVESRVPQNSRDSSTGNREATCVERRVMNFVFILSFYVPRPKGLLYIGKVY
jgi:hypothetical protein